jgi:hypothetical protein
VLEALDREAARAGRRHGVVLMMDLGDLREGWFEEGEFLDAVARVEREFAALELWESGRTWDVTAPSGPPRPTFPGWSGLPERPRIS